MPSGATETNHASKHGIVLFSPEYPVSSANLAKTLPIKLVQRIEVTESLGPLDPFESDKGVHFVSLLEVLAPQPMSFTQALPKVQQDFLNLKEQKRVAAYLSQIRAYYRVSIHE